MNEAPPRGERRWRIERRETLHDGLCRVERVRYSHALHGGGDSGPIEGELFSRGDVAGVLPFDPVRDEVVLVEQFRIGAMHQRPDPWLVEAIAGRIEPGESPEVAAAREAREEAGLELGEVRLLFRYLASPGVSTDEVFVYLAETDLAGVAGGDFGLAREAEDVRARVVPAEVAIRMLETGEVRNALSVVALQWLALRRARR